MTFEDLNSKIETVREGVDTEALSFIKIKELENTEVMVDGFFFTNSEKAGKQVVVVGNGYKINMPKRAVEQFEHIQDDKELLKAVLDGKLILQIGKEITTKKGKSTSYKLKTAF